MSWFIMHFIGSFMFYFQSHYFLDVVENEEIGAELTRHIATFAAKHWQWGKLRQSMAMRSSGWQAVVCHGPLGRGNTTGYTLANVGQVWLPCSGAASVRWPGYTRDHAMRAYQTYNDIIYRDNNISVNFSLELYTFYKSFPLS